MLSIKDEKGAAGLEFTLIFPFLLAMTFGIIEFGALMFDKAILTNAAREGARAGISYNYDGPGDPTCADLTQIETNVTAVVNQYLGNFLINFDPTAVENVIINLRASASVSNEYTLEVRVDYNFQFLFINSIVNLLFGGALNNGLPLDAVAEMRAEDQDGSWFLITNLGCT